MKMEQGIKSTGRPSLGAIKSERRQSITIEGGGPEQLLIMSDDGKGTYIRSHFHIL